MLVKDRIVSERKRRGLSSAELAEMIHVNKGTINRYENGGIKNIPLDILKALASIFECSLDDFIGDDPKYSIFLEKAKNTNIPLSEDERIILKWYHCLPEKQKDFLKEIAANSYQ